MGAGSLSFANYNLAELHLQVGAGSGERGRRAQSWNEYLVAQGLFANQGGDKPWGRHLVLLGLCPLRPERLRF